MQKPKTSQKNHSISITGLKLELGCGNKSLGRSLLLIELKSCLQLRILCWISHIEHGFPGPCGPGRQGKGHEVAEGKLAEHVLRQEGNTANVYSILVTFERNCDWITSNEPTKYIQYILPSSSIVLAWRFSWKRFHFDTLQLGCGATQLIRMLDSRSSLDQVLWFPFVCPGRISAAFPPSEAHGALWTLASLNEAEQWACTEKKGGCLSEKISKERVEKCWFLHPQCNKERKQIYMYIYFFPQQTCPLSLSLPQGHVQKAFPCLSQRTGGRSKRPAPSCCGSPCVQTISTKRCFWVRTTWLNLIPYVTTMLPKVIWKGILIKQHSWLARKIDIVTYCHSMRQFGEMVSSGRTRDVWIWQLN